MITRRTFTTLLAAGMAGAAAAPTINMESNRYAQDRLLRKRWAGVRPL